MDADEIALIYSQALGHEKVLDWHRLFAMAIIERDAVALRYLSNGLNDKGKKVFTQVTGVKLPRGQAATWAVLTEWGGIDPQEMQYLDLLNSKQGALERARQCADCYKLDRGGSVLSKVDAVFGRGCTHLVEISTSRNRKSRYLVRPEDRTRGIELSDRLPKEVVDYIRAKSDVEEAQRLLDGYLKHRGNAAEPAEQPKQKASCFAAGQVSDSLESDDDSARMGM